MRAAFSPLRRLVSARSAAGLAASAGIAAAAIVAHSEAAALPSLAQDASSSSDRWYREWLLEQVTEHPAALSTTEWTPLKVWSVERQSHNTSLIRFVFDDPLASAGMDIASYLLTRTAARLELT